MQYSSIYVQIIDEAEFSKALGIFNNVAGENIMGFCNRNKSV